MTDSRPQCYIIPSVALALHAHRGGFKRPAARSRWRRVLAALATAFALQVIVNPPNPIIVTPSGGCTIINGGGGVLIPICTGR